MIKAIFFDLDGTLLNSDKKITESSMDALQECRKKGIKLFFATARPPLLQKMLSLTEEVIELFDGGSYCNGDCIKTSSFVDYMYLPEDIVDYCGEQIKKYDKMNMALQLKKEKHAFRYPLSDEAYNNWGIDKEDTFDIDVVNKNETVKILIYYENIIDSVTKIPNELVHDLKHHCSDKATIYLTDDGKVIQIVNQHCNKKESIEKIRKSLLLGKSEIAVFGDDINDLEMLLEYENSIAMGNAEDNVKQAARLVTKDNDNEGIAYALKFLLRIY